MKRFLVVLIGVVSMGVFANQALATAYADPGGGYIEVCKAANPALHGSFNFSVWDSFTTDGSGNPTNLVTSAISLTPGTCTSPIAVDPGKVSVTETGGTLGLNNAGQTAVDNSFFTTTATAVGQNSAPTGSFDGKWTYNVTVPAGGPQSVVTVTFTNTLVTGDVEVCKVLAPTSGLSGNWQFTITGANAFSQTVTVAGGDCSAPVVVPAGRVLVQEVGDAAENVTAITATQIAGNVNAIVGPLAGPSADLPNAKVVAAVSVGDATNQTIVKFTNDSVRFKLCKWIDSAASAGTYNFALSSTGNAGPNTVPATASLTATSANNSTANAVCTIIGTFRAGTTVTITEGLVAGQKVNSITATPSPTNTSGSLTIVPGSLSLPNRTVQVVLGAGETVVYYENGPAAKGDFKLCKAAGVNGDPTIPAGTLFPFTLTPVGGGAPISVSVPTGQCADLGPQTFDSTWTIVEGTVTGLSTTVQAITSSPSPFVQVLEGGVCPAGTPTNTNQSVLTNTNLTTRSTNVTISECETTEVTFTNVDPPDNGTTGGTTGTTGGTTGTTGGTTGGSTGSTGSTGSSGGSSGSSGGSSASSGGSSGGSSAANTGGSSSSASTGTSTGTGAVAPAVVPISTGIGLGTTASSSNAAAVKAKLTKAAALATLRNTLKKDKSTLKALVKKLHATTNHKKQHHLKVQIAAVATREAKIQLQIAELDK